MHLDPSESSHLTGSLKQEIRFQAVVFKKSIRFQLLRLMFYAQNEKVEKSFGLCSLMSRDVP